MIARVERLLERRGYCHEVVVDDGWHPHRRERVPTWFGNRRDSRTRLDECLASAERRERTLLRCVHLPSSLITSKARTAAPGSGRSHLLHPRGYAVCELGTGDVAGGTGVGVERTVTRFRLRHSAMR